MWIFNHQQLQTLRKLQNKTPEEFAATVPCARMTIVNWEAGRSAPTVNQLCAIANHFHVDPTSFFLRVEGKQR